MNPPRVACQLTDRVLMRGAENSRQEMIKNRAMLINVRGVGVDGRVRGVKKYRVSFKGIVDNTEGLCNKQLRLLTSIICRKVSNRFSTFRFKFKRRYTTFAISQRVKPEAKTERSEASGNSVLKEI